jgi:hypothetical protein
MKTPKINYVAVGITVLLAAAVAVAAWLVYRHRNDPSDPKDPELGTVELTNDPSFPLKKGSKGANVQALQQLLNAMQPLGLYPAITEDGIFGDNTLDLLQKKLGISEVSEAKFRELTS